jgi:hypothetical protein
VRVAIPSQLGDKLSFLTTETPSRQDIPGAVAASLGRRTSKKKPIDAPLKVIYHSCNTEKEVIK